jgi:uncharacterized membrane protein
MSPSVTYSAVEHATGFERRNYVPGSHCSPGALREMSPKYIFLPSMHGDDLTLSLAMWRCDAVKSSWTSDSGPAAVCVSTLSFCHLSLSLALSRSLSFSFSCSCSVCVSVCVSGPTVRKQPWCLLLWPTLFRHLACRTTADRRCWLKRHDLSLTFAAACGLQSALCLVLAFHMHEMLFRLANCFLLSRSGSTSRNSQSTVVA